MELMTHNETAPKAKCDLETSPQHKLCNTKSFSKFDIEQRTPSWRDDRNSVTCYPKESLGSCESF